MTRPSPTQHSTTEQSLPVGSPSKMNRKGTQTVNSAFLVYILNQIIYIYTKVQSIHLTEKNCCSLNPQVII